MRTLVIMPTYNEISALPIALDSLRNDCPNVDVLIVDDNSPDGTGEWAQEYSNNDPQVHVLHRKSKDGLGRAYIAGFRWALERGYDLIVEMDADSSHRSIDLPALLHAASDADLVIGSRWVPGGAVENWPAHRLFLSRAATTYTRFALGLPVKDATAGFRVYSADILREIPLDEVNSQGYCFQIDMAWRVHQHGRNIIEVPITFVERAQGHSKMSSAIVLEALWRVTYWGITHRARQLRRLVKKTPLPTKR